MKRKTFLFALLLMGLAVKSHAQKTSTRYTPDSVSKAFNLLAPSAGTSNIRSFDAAGREVLEIIMSASGAAVYFMEWGYDATSRPERSRGPQFNLFKDTDSWWCVSPGSVLYKANSKEFDRLITEMMRRLRLSHPKETGKG